MDRALVSSATEAESKLQEMSRKGIAQKSVWEEDGHRKEFGINSDGRPYSLVEMTEAELEKTITYCTYMREQERSGFVAHGVNGGGFVVPFVVSLILKQKYGIDMATFSKDEQMRNKLMRIIETEYPYLKTTNRTLWRPAKAKQLFKA